MGSKEKGSAVRTMLNLVLLATFMTFAGLLLAEGVESANMTADLKLVAREADELYAAFESYFERHLEYPNAYAGNVFELETLDPLAKRGYYRGVLLAKMRGARADAYDSPDDKGRNREFWVEMTLAQDPSIRILVAKSDDAPLSGGRWVEGAFIFRDGDLEPF